MYIAQFHNLFFQHFIFIILTLFIIFLQTHPVLSKGNQPHAVVIGLNDKYIPDISEQILLQKLRNKLGKTYDFSYQSSYEQALQKLRLSTKKESCLHLKCVLKTLKRFPQTSLFLLKNLTKETGFSLVMIGETGNWRVKHESCLGCRLSQEEMLTRIVLRMESYLPHPTSVRDLIPKELSKTVPLDLSLDKDREEISQKNKTAIEEIIPEPRIIEGEIVSNSIDLPPLELLKFKIAERRYNQLIWKNIKKDLMFFRQKHLNQTYKKLKTRLRLQIDQFGKIIERRLLQTSGSRKFDKIIIDSVDQLKLPPPMELLIRHPPYVVTILIQP